MTLKSQIQNDTKVAMKAGDKDRLKVLRLMLAAIKQVEIDDRIELDDSGVLRVLDKMVKQRRDSASQFQQAGRADLETIELAEIAVLEDYLPEQLDDAEIDVLIEQAVTATAATSMRDMGRVMGALRDQLQGRADMGAVGARVRARLNG